VDTVASGVARGPRPEAGAQTWGQGQPGSRGSGGRGSGGRGTTGQLDSASQQLEGGRSRSRRDGGGRGGDAMAGSHSGGPLADISTPCFVAQIEQESGRRGDADPGNGGKVALKAGSGAGRGSGRAGRGRANNGAHVDKPERLQPQRQRQAQKQLPRDRPISAVNAKASAAMAKAATVAAGADATVAPSIFTQALSALEGMKIQVCVVRVCACHPSGIHADGSVSHVLSDCFTSSFLPIKCFHCMPSSTLLRLRSLTCLSIFMLHVGSCSS
jgi:hypothetical protein